MADFHKIKTIDTQRNVTSKLDKRRKVNRFTVLYRSQEKTEHKVTFEVAPGTAPRIPEVVDEFAIDRIRKQF